MEGGVDGHRTEDAEGHLLDAEERRALPFQPGRGGPLDWMPWALTLESIETLM